MKELTSISRQIAAGALFSARKDMILEDDSADRLIDGIIDAVSDFLEMPLDQNPSGLMSYGGPFDYCRDWFWERFGNLKDEEDALKLVDEMWQSGQEWNNNCFRKPSPTDALPHISY